MITHNINEEVYQAALKRENLDPDTLSAKLGISSQELWDWVKNGYPADRVVEFARMLNIKGIEFRKLIYAPIYSVLGN